MKQGIDFGMDDPPADRIPSPLIYSKFNRDSHPLNNRYKYLFKIMEGRTPGDMRTAHQCNPGRVLPKDKRREEGLQYQRSGTCAPPLFSDIEGETPTLSYMWGEL